MIRKLLTQIANHRNGLAIFGLGSLGIYTLCLNILPDPPAVQEAHAKRALKRKYNLTEEQITQIRRDHEEKRRKMGNQIERERVLEGVQRETEEGWREMKGQKWPRHPGS